LLLCDSEDLEDMVFVEEIILPQPLSSLHPDVLALSEKPF
jgi:hypothetical protein